MSYTQALSSSICSVILLATFSTAWAQEDAAPVVVAPQLEDGGKVAAPVAKAEDAQDGKGEDEVAGKLRQQLLGAWLMAPKPGQARDDDSRIGVQQKFFGLGNWIYTLSDPKTGELIGSHGGTYTLNGDVYEEKIVYAAFSTEEMIGNSYKFKMTVEGDRLMQRGIGNNFNEDYTRLQAGDAKPEE